MDERDVINAWRTLFRGQETTPESLAKAESASGRSERREPAPSSPGERT